MVEVSGHLKRIKPISLWPLYTAHLIDFCKSEFWIMRPQHMVLLRVFLNILGVSFGNKVNPILTDLNPQFLNKIELPVLPIAASCAPLLPGTPCLQAESSSTCSTSVHSWARPHALVIAATLLRFVVVVVTVDDHAMLQHLARQLSTAVR